MPAAARVGRELHGIDIATGGLTDAPWPGGRFDYIHANNVLEHESDPLAALRSAHRLLDGGGRLQLVLPNGRFDRLPNDRLFRKLGKPVVTRHSGHLFFYSRRGLEELLERAGFRVLRLETFHFKTALKARGWTRGADKALLRERPRPEPDDNAGETLPLAEYRLLIPPAPAWPSYRLAWTWRRLWRLRNSELGYDFDLLAEKR
jgi:predicted SAM-dependent methyltransferase